jgi:DNA repair protein RadD
MQLREYQSRSIELLYDWMSNNKGHPCVVMPTGSGKSHVIAALCKDAIQTWPETRILMLTHVKELIEQNAEKMRLHWPGAPMGIYSASVGKRQLGEPITFAGIQSVRDKAKLIGHIDLIIIDECHLVNHKDEGGYRKLIGELIAVNPALRIIGYSATPYRLGHGLITDKPALFDALIEPVTIEELIFKKYLATLRSKVTKAKLDTTGVHKRGGEFIESELQAAVDTDDNNQRVAREVIELARDRKAWLVFCTGVKHAQHVAEVLRQQGVTAECVTGETPKKERERMLTEFKAGRLRALTNANVLTTGFDYPDIDLIAMLRPTMSASLYVQMAGRGMRVKSHTDHCLVLDFAGVVATHGPITAVQPPKKAGDGNGEAPVKVCDNCGELCAISVAVCPACLHPFPEPERKKLELHQDDIMGLEGSDLDVTGWSWRKHVSKASGKEMIAVTYYGGLSDPAITEYLPVLHDGYAGDRSIQQCMIMANSSGADLSQAHRCHGQSDWLEYIVAEMGGSNPPSSIEFKRDGKFFRVMKRRWA